MTLLIVPAGEGRRFGPGLTAKLEYGQSPDFAVFQGELPPRSDGPAPHVHEHYDEAFYVLTGSVLFTSDGTNQECAAGAFVFIPRGTAHGFANPAATSASVLVVTTAKAIQLVEQGYALMDGDGRPTDVVALQTLFASHNSQILGPPPA